MRQAAMAAYNLAGEKYGMDMLAIALLLGKHKDVKGKTILQFSNSKTAILLHKPLFESKDAIDLSILLRLVQINDASYGHH